MSLTEVFDTYMKLTLNLVHSLLGQLFILMFILHTVKAVSTRCYFAKTGNKRLSPTLGYPGLKCFRQS